MQMCLLIVQTHSPSDLKKRGRANAFEKRCTKLENNRPMDKSCKHGCFNYIIT